MDVQSSVGHRRGSDLEGVTTVVGTCQRLDSTVVVSSRITPADHCATVTGVVGRGDVAAESQDHRVLVVTDSDVKGTADLIAVDVQSSVGHRRGSDLEGIATVVGARQRLDSTVVSSGRIGPADHSTALTRIVGRGEITAETQNLRVLGVEYSHVEGRGHLIAVDILSFVEDFSGTHREGGSAVMAAGDIDEVAVVGNRRLIPCHDGRTIASVIVDGEITGQATDDRAFLVIDGHVEGSTGRVSVDIDRCEGHGFGSHLEVGSAHVRLGEGLDLAVVLSCRLGPADVRTTFSQIVRNSNVEAQTQDFRVFVVTDSDVEGAADLVAVDIESGVGHRRRSDLKEVSTVVSTSQRLDSTVVISSRIGPADHGTAVTGVVGGGDVTAQSKDFRILIVTDSDVEGTADLVAVDIESGVGHRRRSDSEEVTAVVGARQRLDSTIVLGGRLSPPDQGTTITRIVGRGEITTEAQNHRVLGIEHSHGE